MFMEKTTKKRRSKKGLRKRIGIIAIGGMSVVLTVCLSVGATLAWFAGSTWASKSLYMGGPVYVEMAGRGLAGTTATPGTDDASWQGGEGALDIEAAATRTTGTAELTTGNNTNKITMDDILLPGQKVQIYSQARVFSTAETNTVADAATPNQSSGANTTNTSNGTATYRTESGRVTTTTTSVLRARFSIEVQFDPGMGFNNFTSNTYMTGYPVQSSNYTGDGTTGDGVTWQTALGASFATSNDNTTITYTGRRDAVAQPATTQDNPNPVTWTANQTTESELQAIRKGEKKSIYKWKYVSLTEYNKAAAVDASAPNEYGQKMGAPFAGTPINAADAPTGYYGVWVSEVVDPTAVTKTYKLSEADAFYKARCNAYLGTYVEYYVNEYGNTVTRTVADSVKALEQELNAQFVKLVNDSSDAIHAGKTNGFKVSTDGQMTDRADNGSGGGINASWLYIDPSIGNDTNTDEISTSVGGWWYLVADDGGTVGSTGKGGSVIQTVTDSVTAGDSTEDYNTANNPNTALTGALASGFVRGKETNAAGTVLDSDDPDRLYAKLYEVKPNQALTGTGAAVTINDNGDGTINTTDEVVKTVSEAFPFVNGSFSLPSDALSNLFANAKITFKISFQALQAFFPYTTTIDKVDYTDAIMGTAKALNIKNAIPIFNEAFDYQEKTGSGVSGL